MMAMTEKSPARAARAVLLFGLGVMAVALVWWFAYYVQAGGLSGLGATFACLSSDAAECSITQSQIGSSELPAYSPMMLWAGTVAALIGLYLTRRNKA
jgi:hypothetical protein